MKFKIYASEVIEYEIEVEAKDEDEAQDIAIKLLEEDENAYVSERHSFETLEIKQIEEEENA